MHIRIAGALALVFALVAMGCQEPAVRLNQAGLDAYRGGQYTQARAAFTLAIENNPQKGEYYFNRGMAEQVLSNVDRALADYGIATKLTPRIIEAYPAMAQCYLEKDKPDLALQALETGTKANPINADAFLNVGRFQLARGDLDAAKLWFAKATAADPASARAHREYGLLLARTGNK